VNEKEKIGITFSESSQELLQKDWATGKVLERSKMIKTIVKCRVVISIRGLHQGFFLEGQIQKSAFEVEKLAAQIREAALRKLSDGLIFNLFEETEIYLNENDPEYPGLEAEIQIDKNYAGSLEAQAKIGNKTISHLKNVLKELEDLVTGIPSHYQYEINQKLLFLDMCSRSQGDGNGKIFGIRECVADLIKRKNRNHWNYLRIEELLLSRLSDWPTTNIWTQQPPPVI
jgi:hypothetical protein